MEHRIIQNFLHESRSAWNHWHNASLALNCFLSSRIIILTKRQPPGCPTLACFHCIFYYSAYENNALFWNAGRFHRLHSGRVSCHIQRENCTVFPIDMTIDATVMGFIESVCKQWKCAIIDCTTVNPTEGGWSRRYYPSEWIGDNFSNGKKGHERFYCSKDSYTSIDLSQKLRIICSPSGPRYRRPR